MHDRRLEDISGGKQMKTLLVMIEHKDGTIQYLINADEIAYTTKAVCLMTDNKIVAYFRRDDVISISRHNGAAFTDFEEVAE